MKSYFYKLLLVSPVLFFSAPSLHAETEFTDSLTTGFQQGGQITIKLSAGEHRIIQSEDDHIRVHWTVDDKYQDVDARTRVDGNEATVDVDGPRKNFHTVIEVPDKSDLVVRLSAGVLAIEDTGGDRDIKLRAGELLIEVDDTDSYATVDGSLWAGDIDAGPFQQATSGLFRSVAWRGEGEGDLQFKLLAGDVRLYSSPD